MRRGTSCVIQCFLALVVLDPLRPSRIHALTAASMRSALYGIAQFTFGPRCRRARWLAGPIAWCKREVKVAEGAVWSELDPSFGSLYASELSNVAAKKRSILVGPEASSKVGM